MATNNTDKAIKVNRILLSVQLKFLNLNAKNRMGDTMSHEKMMVIKINNQLWWSQTLAVPVNKGKEVINKVLEGVFNPLNESDCVSSTLKMARRKAAQTAIKNPTYGSQSTGDTGTNILYITNAGSKPKLTMSASESSSLPIGEFTFSQRAAKPSKKSKTAAAQTKYAAGTTLPSRQ